MRKVECFKIRLSESVQDPVWDVTRQKTVHELLCDRHTLTLNPVVIVADPFLFVQGNRLFLFYEEKRNYTPGVIRMISTSDLVHWSKPTTVLKESFHLSYPFVFIEDGTVYMMPETGEVGEVRLYKADNDQLTSFSFYKTLIRRSMDDSSFGYVDSSVIRLHDKYYLITSVEEQGVNVLYLFTSSCLDGPYAPHPSSPICESRMYGRNGGCLLTHKGVLYRVAQDCEIRYGDNVHLFEVDELNHLAYKEHLVTSNLLPTDSIFYAEGGHQLNIVKFGEKYIVATDSKEYHSYTVARMIHKTIQLVGRFLSGTVKGAI